MMSHYMDMTIGKDCKSVTVEYNFTEGSPPTYSPMSGACGGDDYEVEIIGVSSGSSAVYLNEDELELAEEHIVEHHPYD